VHLAGKERDVPVLERVHGAEALLGVLESEHWFRLRCGQGDRLFDGGAA